jgi:hypothetical protein
LGDPNQLNHLFKNVTIFEALLAFRAACFGGSTHRAALLSIA